MDEMKFHVGERFPLPVPAEKGFTLEILDSGLTAFLQLPGLADEKVDAFNAGFSSYNFWESSTPVPVAVWVFNFSEPFAPVDFQFDARVVDPVHLQNFLDTSKEIKGDITFFLLDGDILRGKRTCRLDSAALALFHKTIQKQLSLSYTHEEYLRSCQTILRFNPGALARFGSRYRHMPERDV
ncbi:hypothetical protein [Desulforhabdus amnigena]|jgi:hypothetical protein|uniref:Uncharacterized protein n=1 Tax=Desulforhabdus amnigena TaxID=40218 RepID=A0A9W6D2Q7_9BACT|nr:hypothetical protein [Desulforhabdus amnigena]NLJ26697.1 hypothetical protein [Deltaproteobacteria bacterium]GLI33834.1 hypothetical protein DAMNIGENAA_12670 [Desulforhabdus amnigena]